MKITVAERFRPFTKSMGSYALVPFTNIAAEVFPALIRFHDLDDGTKKELSLPINGPVRDFTLFQDLEKGRLQVFADHQRYQIEERQGKVVFDDGSDIVEIFSCRSFRPTSIARLALGNHKKQDAEMIRRRKDLTEILPLLYRIGNMVPDGDVKGPALDLLENERFLDFYLASIKGLFVPKLYDDLFQGIIPTIPGSYSIALLKRAAEHIAELFFRESGNELYFLPATVKGIHCGRFIGLACSRFNLDMEWRSKKLRCVLFRAAVDQEYMIKAPPFKSCRLRTSPKEKGFLIDLQKPFVTEANQTYLLDRFQN